MFRRFLEPFQQHFVFDGLDMECGVSPVQFFDFGFVEPIAESVAQESRGLGDVYKRQVVGSKAISLNFEKQKL